MDDGAVTSKESKFDPLPSSMFVRPDPNGPVSREIDAMVAAWNRGERLYAEDILARNPELDDEAAIRLVFEEFCLREDSGTPVATDEIAARFPQWQTDLEMLLDCRRMMEPGPSAPEIPCVGEEIAGFRLLAELGKGVVGSVFLASQSALAGRPVVIKVTPRGREEHLFLAQLQHMNIVPLYSAEVLEDRGLQVLCMPFLGGASLAHVLELLSDRPPSQRTGRHVVEALEQIQAKLPVQVVARGPFLRYMAGASYVDAICWIGACLAEGLHYAHERDLVHMDVKPSNVLIGFDGQPMLLDFHLARGPIHPGGPRPAWLGGTPHYMAPEQRDALDALTHDQGVHRAVDGRADLFSLGKILYEALGGPSSHGDPARPLHRINDQVSVGLSDIIARSLANDPLERYPTAGEMAADLRRHLNNQPLRGVANRSLGERWRKRRRRYPYAVPRGLIALALAFTAIASVILLSLAFLHRMNEVETALAEGRADLDRHDHAGAASALERGLLLGAGVPGAAPYRKALTEELAFARKASLAADLRTLVDLVRFRYGVDPPPAAEAESLIRKGREIWGVREMLLAETGGRRDSQVERGIRADLLDFVLFWADLRVRSASEANRDEAAREAVALLDDARKRLGPSPAIDRDRATYAGASVATSHEPALVPQSAWDHYNLGRSYLRSGDIASAAEQFRLGVVMRPQDFWLNFYEGLCAYRLKRFDDARNAFRVCIALAPESPECYHNRAIAHEALGQTEQAAEDYTRALRLNPSLVVAVLNRGVLHFRRGRFAEASADLNHALRLSDSDPVTRGAIHYNLAVVDLARNQPVSARRHLDEAAMLGHEEARRLRDRPVPEFTGVPGPGSSRAW